MSKMAGRSFGLYKGHTWTCHMLGFYSWRRLKIHAVKDSGTGLLHGQGLLVCVVWLVWRCKRAEGIRRRRRRRRREEDSRAYSTVPGSAYLPEQHSPAVQPRKGRRRMRKGDGERVTDTEKIKPSHNQEEIQEERKKQEQMMRTWRLRREDLVNPLLIVDRSWTQERCCTQSQPRPRRDAFTTGGSEGGLSCFAPSGEAGKASDRWSHS